MLLVSRATGVSSARVAGALALERVLDAVSYLVLLSLATMLPGAPGSLLGWRMAAYVALAVAVAALVMLSLASPSRSTPASGRIVAYARRFANSVAETGSPSRIVAALLLSLGAWALQVATYHTIARAAHLSIPLAGSVAAMLAIGISFLIRATPGNVGVFQVIYAMIMTSFGVERGAAVAAALLIQTVQVVPTVLLGTIAGHGLVRRGRRQAIP